MVVFAFGYLPWFCEELQWSTPTGMHASGRRHRVMFLFYMLPNVPFMVLAVTMAIGIAIGKRNAGDVRRAFGASMATSYLAVVLILFGFFYPVLAARNIPYDPVARTDLVQPLMQHRSQTQRTSRERALLDLNSCIELDCRVIAGARLKALQSLRDQPSRHEQHARRDPIKPVVVRRRHHDEDRQYTVQHGQPSPATRAARHDRDGDEHGPADMDRRHRGVLVGEPEPKAA